jgi:hypothetical protein
MARDHARMQTKLWRPESDFRALTIDAQWAYQMLCQQDALSYAGIIDYRAGRFAALAADATTAKVRAGVKKLEKARYVLIDQGTEELLVRTYVRHDGVMDRTNMGKAVGRALVRIVSADLHHAVLSELARLYGEKPHLAGFDGLADLYPDAMDRIRAMSSTIPFPMASGKA